MQPQHFVLVHGMSHGAWCWYRLKPRLESAGHRVTALDMAASGVNTKPVEELRTFAEYNEPLLSFMASLPAEEKVVLVGHSLGGMNIAFAMEKFPEKILAAVFLSAFMPDASHKPSYFLDEIFKKIIAENGWVESQFSTYGTTDEPFILMSLGHQFLAMCYALSPIEDLELAKLLVRPLPNFIRDLEKAKEFSEGGYGSVRRVFVICKDDTAIPLEFQWQMIESSGVKEVKELEGADHMAMFGKPQELCDCLIEIADKYA